MQFSRAISSLAPYEVPEFGTSKTAGMALSFQWYLLFIRPLLAFCRLPYRSCGLLYGLMRTRKTRIAVGNNKIYPFYIRACYARMYEISANKSLIILLCNNIFL